MKKLIFLFAAVLAMVLGPRANAAPQLDFAVPPANGGTFSWAGNGTPLFATNVGVATVTGTGTGNDGTLTITGGLLNATTGNGTFNGTEVDFGAGPANGMTIFGSILGNPAENLLTGTVQSATLTDLGGQSVLDVTFFSNTIAADLAANYGVATSPWAGAFHIDFTLPDGVTFGSAFTGAAAGSGDIVDHPVPEPSSMAIAGLGALGLIGYGIRRRRGA